MDSHLHPEVPLSTVPLSEEEFRANVAAIESTDGEPGGDWLNIGFRAPSADLARGALVVKLTAMVAEHKGKKLVYRFRPIVGTRRNARGFEYVASARRRFE